MNYRNLMFLFAATSAWAQPTSPLKEFLIEPGAGGHYSMKQDSIDAEGISLRDLLAFSYGLPPGQVTGPGLLSEKYHVVASAPGSSEAQFREALRDAVSAKLQIRESQSTKQIQVFVLKSAAAERARTHESSGTLRMEGSNDTLSVRNAPVAQFAKFLAQRLGHPVIDETGLLGVYSADFAWADGDVQSLAGSFKDMLGLVWSEQKREMPVIVVDRR
jgi:uncharacterized protein (TIGR03435 family)